MINITTVNEVTQKRPGLSVGNIGLDHVIQNLHLSDVTKQNTLRLREVLELIKENQTCSIDLMNSFEWAVSGFIEFLIHNGVKPDINNTNLEICERWLYSLEEENQNKETIIMKIITITSFFSHLNDLGIILYNPFVRCYEQMNILLIEL
ncbi:hypothetical protein M3182_00520 [Mesobacillus maritimus]|uniref:hypothetical protein n=1 Tax=Mesobacillus maritimus TaxID=1643336 RepID=UPI00203FC898|nr:hypothetical protein [Mesobacillus maritimus]MCM3584223.1 hypothetical protein [Mesobacillus maritimus]